MTENLAENLVNVLCLHGCNQSEKMFRDLLKQFIKLGEKQYNLKFHFVEAKYDHPLGGKTWYNRPLDVAAIGSIPFDEDLVRDCLSDIATVIKEKNIHVLFGFSQGGNVVDTFLAYKYSASEFPSIKCAVILSGYSLQDSNRKDVDVPVLGVISSADDIVPAKYNPTGYTKGIVLEHDKGHKLPTKNPQIREILMFMKDTKIQ